MQLPSQLTGESPIKLTRLLLLTKRKHCARLAPACSDNIRQRAEILSEQRKESTRAEVRDRRKGDDEADKWGEVAAGGGRTAKQKERWRHGFPPGNPTHTHTHSKQTHMAYFSLKWDSTHSVAGRISMNDVQSSGQPHTCVIHLPQGGKRKKKQKVQCQLSPPRWHTGYKNELEWAVVECARTSTQNDACKGEKGKKMGYGWWWGGLASNLQGLASNTIWRETIQFAKDKRREGGTDEEEEQRD